MDKFIIHGGKPLHGTVAIGGAKNAALPVMAAALLTDESCIFRNVPRLKDIRTMCQLLNHLGVTTVHEDGILTVHAAECRNMVAPYHLVKKMRASIYVLGPLLGRFKKAKVSLPGGCAFGPRPVNLHLMAMEKLGATIRMEEGYIIAEAPVLHGNRIHFDVSSVGATGNAMMAAVYADGTTILENAAREPDIVYLADVLNRMGAGISGHGTDTIRIEGKTKLHGIDSTVIPDRIEFATFLTAAAITQGHIEITNANPEHARAVMQALQEANVQLQWEGDACIVDGRTDRIATNITTGVYPGFPTDMQAQFTALMAITVGTSVVKDTIYTERFNHVPELNRLGADIRVIDDSVVVHGVSHFTGAPVTSTDLRASASLVLAGLAAEGETNVYRVYHIDRGYEQIEVKLQALGADILRTKAELDY